MKIYEGENSRERRILAAMIHDKTVLGQLSEIWQEGMLKSPVSNAIGHVCVKFYRKHKDAPNGSTNDWVDNYLRKKRVDADTADAIGKLLFSIEDDKILWDDIKPEHVVDMASEYLREIKANRVCEKGQELLRLGDLEGAEKLLVNYTRPELGEDEHINPLANDGEVFDEAFQKETFEPLFTFKNPLDQFFQGMVIRGEFMVFTAPPKTGKSFWLMEMAYKTLEARLRVAVYQVGDMSKNEYLWRLGSRIAHAPFESQTGNWPYTINVPETIKKPGEDEDVPRLSSYEQTFKNALDGTTTREKVRDFIQNDLKTYKDMMIIKCYPNNTVSVDGINASLDGLAVKGFIPDVVVIDYVDLLAPIDRRSPDKREQINETWKALRALNQRRHCLLITATQSDSAGYGKKLLSMENFSDCRMKNDHCTFNVGINATSMEKEAGVCRLNRIYQRRGRPNKRPIYVAGCLDLANPAVCATW